jgi:DNA-damage-inducible protein J
MSKTTSLALRLDADLKEQASSVAEALGMDLTTAIRLYLTQLVFHKGIPFPIALEKQENIPNAETIEAFKWTENYIKSGKKKGFRTTKDLYKTWDLDA